MSLPDKVSIVEVGARDGLQNEHQSVALADKLALIEGLALAGLKHIEAGSFVNPKWVPQMADSEAVYLGLKRSEGVSYPALTPNLQGFERALEVGVEEVAIFAAASEAFSQSNINCSIKESLKRFEKVMAAAAKESIPVRGYVSCVLGCPIAGEIQAEKVAPVVQDLLDMGCYEVSLGDTIGAGTAGSMERLLDVLLKKFTPDKLAIHCHDTYGQALSNILVALQHGIATIDSSVAGLGGCPYADGATGNVATEDVAYMLDGMGIETGIDLRELIATGNRISAALGRKNSSRTAVALSTKWQKAVSAERRSE
jgi:hydroxymethylglutaryl-CoA lyase